MSGNAGQALTLPDAYALEVGEFLPWFDEPLFNSVPCHSEREDTDNTDSC